MKKGFLVVSALVAVSWAAVMAGNFYAVKAPQDKPQSSYFIMQESGSVPGATAKLALAGAATEWQVRDRVSGAVTYAKGIKVFQGATAGVIYIHLLDNPAGTYDKYYLAPGDKEGVIFDKIQETGTTINLDSIMVLL